MGLGWGVGISFFRRVAVARVWCIPRCQPVVIEPLPPESCLSESRCVRAAGLRCLRIIERGSVRNGAALRWGVVG